MRLDALPVELLYEIHLLAVSPSLPLTSKYLYCVFKSAPPTLTAKYILIRANYGPHTLTRALRYRICSEDVLDAVCRVSKDFIDSGRADLPQWLFRDLAPRAQPWTEYDPPLPFLRHLYSKQCCRQRLRLNSHRGFALTKAVYAEFTPLVRFLLDKKASPKIHRALPVMTAIYRKNLALVRMLIERDGGRGNRKTTTSTPKKRKLADRVEVNSEMLREAVRLDARDIVVYLVGEKGCQPDMQALSLLLTNTQHRPSTSKTSSTIQEKPRSIRSPNTQHSLSASRTSSTIAEKPQSPRTSYD